jgi:hypothetical protein
VATVRRVAAVTVDRLRVVAAAATAARLRAVVATADLQAVDLRVAADSVGLRVEVDLPVMVDLLRVVVDLHRAASVVRLRKASVRRAALFRRAAP